MSPTTQGERSKKKKTNKENALKFKKAAWEFGQKRLLSRRHILQLSKENETVQCSNMNLKLFHWQVAWK